MPTKQQATEIIAGKFWITYNDDGTKNGTLKIREDGNYDWFPVNPECLHETITKEDIGTCYEFTNKTVSSEYQRHLFGYPIPESDVFKSQERDNLPVFTKSAKSLIYFAAGYYIINYPINGWAGHFCPKTATLRKNSFLGPFKTEADMNIILKRKIREDGQ